MSRRFYADLSEYDMYLILITPGKVDVYASQLVSTDEVINAVHDFDYQPAIVFARDPDEARNKAIDMNFVRIKDALEFVQAKYGRDPTRMNPAHQPLTDDEYWSNPGEKALVGADFMRRNWMKLKKHVNSPLLLPDFNELKYPLGFGMYGIVYQTQIPEIALKITDHKYEATFAKFAMENPRPGLVPYFDVLEIHDILDPRYQVVKQSRSSFAIWRLYVTDVGDVPEPMKEQLVEYSKAVHRLASVMNLDPELPIVLKLVAEVHNALRHIKDARIRKMLTFYIYQGWMLGDIHENNVGLDDTRKWVIFDYIPHKLSLDLVEAFTR